MSDAALFFGRERLVAELVSRLAGTAVLCVVGPSGSGKSSAVRAGLLPALAAGVLPGSEDWLLALFRPGRHPDASSTVPSSRPSPTTFATGFEPARTLAAALEALPPESRLAVVVDQFEEAFTLASSEERAAFVELLLEAARDSERRGDHHHCAARRFLRPLRGVPCVCGAARGQQRAGRDDDSG